ncbi:unnamed protein product [Ostreobium quekettii]|uniref:F-box/LRR-repeat protein 15-like leucin rich repeat domain-containing protein n=1 Tax=Ostreobium quekettii TaxID=121088 RepID=A0A8S1J2N0_9CHLO|nr:unnamed protein product [Ostreobium quekettii]
MVLEVWWTAREWPDWLPNIQQSEEAPRPGDPPNGWQCLPADVIHRILHVYKRELGSRVVRPACRILGQVNKHWHGALNAEVTSLQLRAGIPPGDISRLMRRFKYLERLRLQQCDQACLAAICAHPHSHMRVVDLQGCQEVTDEGLLRIGGLGRLQHLDLTNCVQVSDDGLQALTSLTSLRFLNLRVSWSGKTAAPVAACLRAFTPRGFSALGRLPSLTELSLKGRREVDDDMLLELAELSALASLKLSTTNITDRHCPGAS